MALALAVSQSSPDALIASGIRSGGPGPGDGAIESVSSSATVTAVTANANKKRRTQDAEQQPQTTTSASSVITSSISGVIRSCLAATDGFPVLGIGRRRHIKLTPKIVSHGGKCSHIKALPLSFSVAPAATTKPASSVAGAPAPNSSSCSSSSSLSSSSSSTWPALSNVLSDVTSGAKQPAKVYPFVLDDFQRESISCVENGENVLVAAHTSAGKTVVAEYAIAVALRDKQRVIYTAPIKALSNQKFRELNEEFTDVGLMTGDVNLKPNASVLVMTTEILRNMLYRGSEVLREVGWVIFDEVHYMRDRERGVVWEESIILLPPQIKLVFLSATLSNATVFAEWVADLRQAPCHVVSTDVRPTPLQHYVFPSGGDGLYLVLDETGHFKSDNFAQAARIAAEGLPSSSPYGAGGGGGGRNSSSLQSDCGRIVNLLMKMNFAPAIVFSFSRLECEGLALQLANLDFTDAEEKKLTDELFSNALESLSEADRELPQLENALPLLRRGIGVHHSGLLPILKESVELLFQEGLIKVLFATETFSLGVNMPAKTVVFTTLSKFDGQTTRWITSGEYIQMSGRAGRRGRDDRGICILMINDELDAPNCHAIVKGAPDPLVSTFHLGWNMVLNLLRGESQDPETVIEKSFHHFLYVRRLPNLSRRIQHLQRLQESLADVAADTQVDSAHRMLLSREEVRTQLYRQLMQPEVCLLYLQPGRLVYIKEETTTENGGRGEDWGWGVVLNFMKRYSPNGYIVDVLLPVGVIQRLGKLLLPRPATAQHKASLLASSSISSSSLLSSSSKSKSTSSSTSILTSIHPFSSSLYSSYAPNGYTEDDSDFQSDSDSSSSDSNSDSDEDTSTNTRKRLKLNAAVNGNGKNSTPDNSAKKSINTSSTSSSSSSGGVEQSDVDTQDLHGEPQVVRVTLPMVQRISSIRLYMPLDVRPLEPRLHLLAQLRQVLHSFPQGLPLVNPLEDPILSATPAVIQLGTRITSLGERLAVHPLAGISAVEAHHTLAHYCRKQVITAQLVALNRQMKTSHMSQFRDDLKNRMRALRRLGHISEEGAILQKGRVACEVEAVDECVVTELIFDGVFNALEPAHAVALLSCMFPMEKVRGVSTTMTPDLAVPLKTLQAAALHVATVCKECKLEIDVKKFVDSFQPTLMPVVLAWAQGKPFADVCAMTSMFEGSIVRYIRRLHELLTQLSIAAHGIGNEDLQDKFNKGMELLKRGIVFSSSLYL